jgi:predicted AAA+ superfamily ATPase
MNRDVFRYLDAWRTAYNRRVLLIRGARQVGKTYAVRKLGEQFSNFLEINFEKQKQIKAFFSGSLEPASIVRNLSAFFDVPITPGKTLLFFDEIQACPNAISSLRFFYEEMPELHVVAAGSLIEFALNEIPSMGVGRISSLFMYPMNFNEFLEALGDKPILDMMHEADFSNPLDEPFHLRLIERLKEYLLIGGLPGAVRSYAETRDLRITQTYLDDMIITIKDDFAKYKDRAPVARLTEVFESLVFQTGTKFKYSALASGRSAAILGDALNLLVHAGIAYKIHHSSARGLPLMAQADPRKFKTVLFDIGIHQRLLGLDLSNFLLSNDFKAINRGHIAEAFVAQELFAYNNASNKLNLHYWHREAKSSNAEVDYVIQTGDSLLPIEVKSGTKGQMQSIRIFMKERGLSKGIRVSLENFGTLGDIDILPLYAIKHLCQPM